jgi:hypothetical protein
VPELPSGCSPPAKRRQTRRLVPPSRRLPPSRRNDSGVRPQGIFFAGVRALPCLETACRNRASEHTAGSIPSWVSPPVFGPPKRTVAGGGGGPMPLSVGLSAARHRGRPDHGSLLRCRSVSAVTPKSANSEESKDSEEPSAYPTPYRVFHPSCMPPARHRGSLYGVLPASEVCAQLGAVPCAEAPVVPLMGIRPAFAVCACGMVHLAMDSARDLCASSLLAHSPRWSSACASRKLSTRLSSWCQPPWRFFADV